jgi:hypothetical protein
MPVVKARQLRRQYELDGAAATLAHLREALHERHLRPEDFSLRDLAEQFCGPGFVAALDPRHGGAPLLEEADGIDVTAFRNITGQVVYSKILEGYHHEEFVASRLVETIPTRLDGEKIPGVARVGDVAEPVAPGMPYPTYGFGEDYIETPSTVKHGLIVPVTREAIFFDRTNLVLQRASEVGQVLGLHKEKRLLDVMLGAVNTYNRNGTVLDTYQTSGPWVNHRADNELRDWTSADAAEQLLAAMLDPHTGEPILVAARHVLVTPAYRHAAARVFEATDIRYTTGPTETTASNPLAGQYTVHASRLLLRRIVASGIDEAAARGWWFLGDFRRAFAYMENWPITVTQAPAGSEAEFTHDIVVRYKASERGTPAVLDPRYVIRNVP